MESSRRKDGFTGYVVILFIAIGIFVLLQERNPGVTSMSPDDALQLLNRDSTVLFLDVRTTDEWNSSTGHIKNAVLIPLQDLRNSSQKLAPHRGQLIIVYCRSGNRSGKAARILLDSGFHAVNLRGGIREWNAKHYPVYEEHAQ